MLLLCVLECHLLLDLSSFGCLDIFLVVLDEEGELTRLVRGISDEENGLAVKVGK
ncbi:hypothetical protein KC19_10G032500 [Ceratodon purpureus]|uniref:Uncharacterized protein n=1 Tax=Ceratodon purpureus TaxID=3225 RepID=A0A8T0GJS8_CERPU|nr:hypothetical protein KC19_10G032500 [Ceratodon purpureus]